MHLEFREASDTVLALCASRTSNSEWVQLRCTSGVQSWQSKTQLHIWIWREMFINLLVLIFHIGISCSLRIRVAFFHSFVLEGWTHVCCCWSGMRLTSRCVPGSSYCDATRNNKVRFSPSLKVLQNTVCSVYRCSKSLGSTKQTKLALWDGLLENRARSVRWLSHWTADFLVCWGPRVSLLLHKHTQYASGLHFLFPHLRAWHEKWRQWEQPVLNQNSCISQVTHTSYQYFISQGNLQCTWMTTLCGLISCKVAARHHMGWLNSEHCPRTFLPTLYSCS